MARQRKVALTRISTGVPGLDEVLGGGLPEYSFNLLAGDPGSGKTTLAHQIVFANATSDRRALYFTVLGEPTLKMLRYLQQMSFFDLEKVGDAIRFVDLSDVVLHRDLNEVLETMVAHVKEVQPAFVVVDSFRTIVRSSPREGGETGLQGFLQRLALYLTSWQATTFLVGEYAESEIQDNPIFTIADSIFWLAQVRERSSIVRKLQVMKVRGQATMPGLQTFRIDDDGIQVFPRIQARTRRVDRVLEGRRALTGIAGLDKMMDGGIPEGDSTLVAGPSGVGKTCLSTQFIAEGARCGERGVVVVFEEHPEDYLTRAKALGFDLASLAERGMLSVIALRPLDLSVDETLQEIRQEVERIGAKRLVIDSLSGFEVALAPGFREDFRESLYRMVGSLTGAGVTIVMTVEVTEAFGELRFSPHGVSFLTENIILLRYIELFSALKRVIAVIKMRRSNHSNELREFEITSSGIVVQRPLTPYEGVLTGAPKLRARPERSSAHAGLTADETAILELLVERHESSVEEIVDATGIPASAVKRAVDHLVALDHVLRRSQEGKTLFRPVARALGE